MTPEERQSLIDEIIHEVTERLYKSLPEIVGNLASSAASHADRFRKFYEKHPEFKNHKEIVGHAIAEIEGKDPLKPYDEMLELAIPKIQESIELKNKVDMNSVDNAQVEIQRKSLQADRSFIDRINKR